LAQVVQELDGGVAMSGPFIGKLKEERERARAKSYTLVCAKDVIIKAKSWVWKGHLLRGAQELLTGIPGLGKSQVQIHFVACVTAGLTWPDGTAGQSPANIIMLTAEDVLHDEVVPRLMAAGADTTRVHILKSIKKDGNDRQFLLGEDLDALEKAVIKVGNVGLITIDPITAFMGGKMDSHKTTEVRSQLGPLKDFAERLNIAVSTITHPPKSAGQKAIDHFIGSQAFIAAGRIGHVCIEEVMENDSDRKTGRILFANAKNNPHLKMPTLAYRVVERIVGQDPDTRGNIAAPHVVWEKEAVNMTADEAVAAAAGGGSSGKKRGNQAEVQRFLQDILNGGDQVPVKRIVEEGAMRGFSYEQLRTASKNLGIATKQLPRGWVWQDKDQNLL
jgi:putative DNA primase/helicase